MSLSKRLRAANYRGLHPLAAWRPAYEVDGDDGPKPAAPGWYRVGRSHYREGEGPYPTFRREDATDADGGERGVAGVEAARDRPGVGRGEAKGQLLMFGG